MRDQKTSSSNANGASGNTMSKRFQTYINYKSLSCEYRRELKASIRLQYSL